MKMASKEVIDVASISGEASDILKKEEREAVEQFIHQLSLENAFSDGVVVSEEEAIKFMMARKFDVGRAISLYHSNQMMRGKFELEDLNPHVEPLGKELQSGKFTILKGKGEDSATICLFYAKKHFPKYVDHITVLRSLVFQLDHVMKYRDTQRNGLSLIYNMSASGYQNFDFDLAMKVLHLLKGGYPARLKHVYILSAPIWFRASLAVLSSFLRDKIRDRVEVLKNSDELFKYIPAKLLPTDLGGKSDHNHAEWLQECINSARNDVKTIVLAAEDVNSKEEEIFSPKVQNKEDQNNTTEITSNGYLSPEKELPSPPPLPHRPPSPRLSSSPRRSPSPNFLPFDKPLPLPPPDQDENDDDDEEDQCFEQGVLFTFDELLYHLKASGRQGLHMEYEEIRSLPPTGSFEATIISPNLSKNRYGNILAYEDTRVKLNHINNDIYSDYIHANYVDGYQHPKKFICAQGPLPQTFADFWRMIWEQKVIVIIMVTRCVERGRTKCGQYWPEYQDETVEYGDISVTNVTSDVQNDFTTILFDIHNTQLQISRRVCHVQFTSWPDFGVLTSANPIIDVIQLVEQYQKEGMVQIRNEAKLENGLTSSGDYTTLNDESDTNKYDEGSGEYVNPFVSNQVESTGNETVLNNAHNQSLSSDADDDLRPPPIVIHCSAGVGRTGTFCCLSNSIDRFNIDKNVDIFNTVKQIRDQRAFSVQTPDQYQFCYTGLIEYVIRKSEENSEPGTQRLKKFLYEFIHGEFTSDSE